MCVCVDGPAVFKRVIHQTHMATPGYDLTSEREREREVINRAGRRVREQTEPEDRENRELLRDRNKRRRRGL